MSSFSHRKDGPERTKGRNVLLCVKKATLNGRFNFLIQFLVSLPQPEALSAHWCRQLRSKMIFLLVF